MSFNTEILQKFKGIRYVGKHVIYDRYAISNDQGDIAELLIYENEISILIDNFPGQKKHYKYDFPVESAQQFRSDMLRIGLELKWKPVLCTSCGTISSCEDGETCESCDRAELN